MTPEIKKKLSILNTGKNHPQYGKPKSEETKQKLREFGKNRKFSEETKKKISVNVSGSKNGFYGKHHSTEYKQKSSQHKTNVYKNKENHPRYDKTIYRFFNKITKKLFEGTRYNFYTTYNISKVSLCQLIKGKLKSCKKWVMCDYDYCI
jgi:magnesium-transporting ATPase (P-type)